MRLILVRHGQTASNVRRLLDTAVPGADLDEIGRDQAAALPGRLARWGIEAVYASDLARAKQTATPLASAVGCEVVVLPGLREISAGEDELAEDADRYVEVMMGWLAGRLAERLPGGEDGTEFFGRYDAAVAKIASAGHEVAALVSHGAALRTWCGVRVEGVDNRLGVRGWLANVGYVVADGDPATGWRAVAVDGIRHD